MRLPPLPTSRELLDLYKIRALKMLGQNFILDMNVARKIVGKAGPLKDKYVLEVGPGPGPLSRAILESEVKQLAVIEKDRRFQESLQLLADTCGSERVKVNMGDVLKFEVDKLFPDEAITAWEAPESNVSIIANLPFNISTPLTIKWLKAMSIRDGIFHYGRVPLTLTYQLEVAQRMVAPPGNEQRCRLSLMTQYLTDVRLKHMISRKYMFYTGYLLFLFMFFLHLGGCFVPKPEVDAALIHMRPRLKPLFDHPFELVERLTRTVFHHRQKSFHYGIYCLFPPQLRQSAQRFAQNLPIPPKYTPYMLENHQFGLIFDTFAAVLQRHPSLASYDFVQTKKTAPFFHDFAMNNSLVDDLNRCIDEAAARFCVPFEERYAQKF